MSFSTAEHHSVAGAGQCTSSIVKRLLRSIPSNSRKASRQHNQDALETFHLGVGCSDCDLEEEAYSAMASALRHNAIARSFTIAEPRNGSCYDMYGLFDIADALSENVTLQGFQLRGVIGRDASDAKLLLCFAEALKNNMELKTFKLQGFFTSFPQRGFDRSLPQGGFELISMASSIGCNDTLLTLDLEINGFTGEAAVAFAEAIANL